MRRHAPTQSPITSRFALLLALLVLAQLGAGAVSPGLAQEVPPEADSAPRRPTIRTPRGVTTPRNPLPNSPAHPPPTGAIRAPPAKPAPGKPAPASGRPIAPTSPPGAAQAAPPPVPGPALELPKGQQVIAPTGGPPATDSVDKKEAGKNAKTVQMNFDKKDLAEVIQWVANWTQRNFILPERVSGKITILTNAPIPAEEVWNVFVAALEANNWAVYPVGRYWKLSEKKASARANIPLYIDADGEAPANESMITKVFKLKFIEAEQMRNLLNQFTSRDSDFQIFPPDTMIISELGLNMRRLERFIEALDQPGGSEEVHVVQTQFGTATELAQKLNEVFTAQQTKVPGGPKQVSIAPPMTGAGGAPSASNQSPAQGAIQVTKIIAEDRTNKLIIIANQRAFAKVLELLRQLDVPSSEGGVHVYYLENAKSDDVAATLQALAQGASSARRRPGGAAPAAGGAPAAAGTADLFSGEVKITADKNTNSLVIIASNSDYRNVVKVIERLDIRRRQVFVEAVIMEVNLQNETDFGASLHGGTLLNNLSFQGANGQGPLVFGSELGGLSSLGGVTSLASLGGFLAGLQGPPITVSGLSIPSFAVLINALQNSSDVNVVSTPTVTMTDNSEGEITVGQNVPFQAGYSPQISGLSSALGSTGTTGLGSLGLGGLGSLYAPIQRQNVELRLKIKPQINDGDYVRLEVDEQTDEIASTDKTLGPTTSKRTAKTTVVAKDQETVVIGGLIQERTIKSINKLPILGDIPVLGWLFRNETTKKTRTNLLLFLTPYIIRDQGDYRKIFERKVAERAEFVKRFTGDESRYETAIDYSRKPSPLSRVFRTIDTEMNRAENGGSGVREERLIGPKAPRVGDLPAAAPAPLAVPGAPAPAALPPKPAAGPARKPVEVGTPDAEAVSPPEDPPLEPAPR